MQKLAKIKPTSDQVKAFLVLWIRSYLTGQQVQFGWRSIDLKRKRNTILSKKTLNIISVKQEIRCFLVNKGECELLILTVLWEIVKHPNLTPHFLFCQTFLILKHNHKERLRKSEALTCIISLSNGDLFQPSSQNFILVLVILSVRLKFCFASTGCGVYSCLIYFIKRVFVENDKRQSCSEKQSTEGFHGGAPD